MVATYQTSLAVGYGDARWYSYLLPTVGVTAMAIFVFCKEHCLLKGWSPAWKRRLVTLSTLSFGMYLLHIFWLTIVKYLGLNVVDYPALIAVPVSTVIIFVLSFVTTYILSKIPIIKISVR